MFTRRRALCGQIFARAVVRVDFALSWASHPPLHRLARRGTFWKQCSRSVGRELVRHAEPDLRISYHPPNKAHEHLHISRSAQPLFSQPGGPAAAMSLDVEEGGMHPELGEVCRLLAWEPKTLVR